jgi:hypothetical protein
MSARNSDKRKGKELAMCSQHQLWPGAPDSVRCARLAGREPAALGKMQRRTTIIQRTVRWCIGLSGEPTVGRAICGRRVARSNGRLGTPDCPMCMDSVRCANRPR